MNGLLRKDFELVFLSKKRMIAFIVIGFLMFFVGYKDSYSFVVSYLTIIMAMQVMTTISYDEFEHSNTFIMTLPISRKQYVLEKYMFSVLMMLIGWIGSNIMAFIAVWKELNEEGFSKVGMSGISILIGIIFMMCIMIPLQLKFGGENGRMIVYGFVAGALVIGFGTKKICSMLGIDIAKVIGDGSNRLFSTLGDAGTILLLLVAFVAIIFYSIFISIRILEKKEY